MFHDIDHTYVLFDECGEAFGLGVDEMFRPILTDPSITVIATAQNFHRFRKTDTEQETHQRLAAFLRRFGHILTTSVPTKQEVLQCLVNRMKRWGLRVDDAKTLHLLVTKSKCNVGYAVRGLRKAFCLPNQVLTYQAVQEFDVDPTLR
jgi:hypothetical protein